ncbi:Chloroperoxidase [Aspergillus desertorum]
MKTSVLSAGLSLIASAVAFPQHMDIGYHREPREWIAPGPYDYKSVLVSIARGPCPGLNTLANHGYLPRNGKGITLEILMQGMLEGFNIEHGDAVLLFSQAIRTSPFPSLNKFDLADLGRHGILEHDISLSRSDAYFADPKPFNETVWAETMSYFITPMITTNPAFELSWLAEGFSWGECASFFEIMADGTTGTVNKRYIDYWFRNERMPTELGWQQRNVTMKGSELEKYSELLMEAAGVKKRDLASDVYGRPFLH